MSNLPRKIIAEGAFQRFSKNSEHIEDVKEGIEKTRSGESTLVEIQSNPDILKKRIDREPMPVAMAVERINGTPNFQDILVLRKIFKLADSVGKIVIRTSPSKSVGFGTGFLIAPGIVITNHHVFPNSKSVEHSFIQFNYELNDQGLPRTVKTYHFDPDKLFVTSSLEKDEKDPTSGLDFSIIALKEKSIENEIPITEIPHATLDESLGKIVEGENCVVIQHPQGDYKKIVLKDIRMLTLSEDFLIYESDTLPGSSGAMVLGLGTGEVVALHHSGVPRKNEKGEWLRKDGDIVRAGDPDDAIDWIGNEGIRVSSILKTLKAMKVPRKMQASLNKVLRISTTIDEKDDTNKPKEPTPDPLIVVDDQTKIKPNEPLQHLHFFEIELADNEFLQLDWKENYKKLIPEIVSNEALFPMSTDSEQRKLFYIGIRSNKNPWEIAAYLEDLPQIEIATPDLPVVTDIAKENLIGIQNSDVESTKNRFAQWNESEFLGNWKTSHYTKDFISKKDHESIRKWNRKAVNLPDSLEELKDWNKISEHLSEIKLIQLDTGYTTHSKVLNGYNLIEDEDFMDGNDAKDEMNDGVLQFPGHGARTASIVIGNQKSSFENDGNFGVLYSEGPQRFQLIPYRIAQSVVLIGRGKNLVDAANHAINSGADVMFMCMGSYPRPMIYEVAKSAYDRGVIWVCAAGNEVEMVVAPALYPGTIAVAAFNPNQRPWKGSSYGNTVDIAAPGEDVYVPFEDESLKEIMAYGSGTSYATPHVASAAVLWKAKHQSKLTQYNYPWQIVEAFRYCLKQSASKNKPAHWDSKNYGAGILDIQALLDEPLPKKESLEYAYANNKGKPSWDLGLREGVHYLWQTLVRKIKPGPESYMPEMMLSPRAQTALSSLSTQPIQTVFERTSEGSLDSPILKMYFESYE
ncbi:S8 family serine peptidase [Moheibacter stercoris]|uniref:Serine protease n=1 Tax=Moheibacter stercoris TaxID=1628251 RepID=A0ABV2LUD3_9FLAO